MNKKTYAPRKLKYKIQTDAFIVYHKRCFRYNTISNPTSKVAIMLGLLEKTPRKTKNKCWIIEKRMRSQEFNILSCMRQILRISLFC